MSKGGRNANYRAGDRAETLGISLLKSLCAVAPVPREEDFGLFDAVATLLRRSGTMLYPEDTFTVQFKSRTVKEITYEGELFQALLKQETASFVAKVDLTEHSIKLFSLAPVLAHPNIADGDLLTLQFGEESDGFNPSTRQAGLCTPALEWTATDTEDREFQDHGYEVLKKWLELDRQNRLQRAMGLQIQIRWEPGKVPVHGGVMAMSSPDSDQIALKAAAPAIQFLLFRASQDDSMLDPTLQLTAWLRDRGMDPDPGGITSFMAIVKKAQRQAEEVQERHSDADLALAFIPQSLGPHQMSFWLMPVLGAGKRYVGTFDELRELGFEVEVDPDTDCANSLGLGPAWLEERKFELLGEEDLVFLLGKID